MGLSHPGHCGSRLPPDPSLVGFGLGTARQPHCVYHLAAVVMAQCSELIVSYKNGGGGTGFFIACEELGWVVGGGGGGEGEIG